MKIKKLAVAGLAVLIILWLGATAYHKERNSPNTSVGTTSPIILNPSLVEWVSKAMIVDEVKSESSLIVRARAVSDPVTRVLRQEQFILDKNGTPTDTAVSATLFSDTEFEIIETYQGKPRTNISVTQTGGFDPLVSKNVMQVGDDPLYKAGEEYILFLVDISGDSVQAPNRELYRIVNPFGRYKVNGESVFPYGQNLMRSVKLPASVKELEAQIMAIPGDLALHLALESSKDEGLGGWQIPPEKVYGQVVTYSKAVQFIFDKPIDSSTKEYEKRDKTVWLVAFEGKFVEHVPTSAGGDIPAKDVIHNQLAVILDGNTGEVMRQVMPSPQTKLPFSNLPILQSTRKSLPPLPTRGPILTEEPYPTLPFVLTTSPQKTPKP